MQELLEVLEIPYTGSGVHACMRCFDKVLTKHALRDGGLPTPDWVSLGEIGFRSWGPPRRSARIEQRLRFPLVVKPVSQGSSLGVKFARTPDGAAGGARRRALLRHARAARAPRRGPRAGGLAARRRRRPAAGAADRRGGAARAEFYDFAARYEIGRTDFVCPAAARAATSPSGCARSRSRPGGCSAPRLRARRHDPRRGRADGARDQPDPGLTETSLLPQAADAAGVAFDEVVERVLAEALAR